MRNEPLNLTEGNGIDGRGEIEFESASPLPALLSSLLAALKRITGLPLLAGARATEIFLSQDCELSLVPMLNHSSAPSQTVV